MWRRMMMMAWKELIQIRRDVRMLAVVIILPTFALLVYGYAINLDVKHVRLGIWDQSATAASRDLVGAFSHSEYFDIVAVFHGDREVTDALGITAWFDAGGFQKELLLGSDQVGQEALIRFYLLHIMVLPLALVILLAVHFWRVRKDGGLVRPVDAEARLGPIPAGTYPVFTEAPQKTWSLAALVKGKTPAVGRGPEGTLPSMPHLMYAEMAVFMLACLACVVLSLLSDAPLKELANPAVPENPAKAPWYFLGLQELVSFSAFTGGIGIPTIVLLGLGLIPFLDREEEGTGLWFGGPGGGRIAHGPHVPPEPRAPRVRGRHRPGGRGRPEGLRREGRPAGRAERRLGVRHHRVQRPGPGSGARSPG
jgi:hypothetical protein